MTHTYQIGGMHCGSCINRVKSELLKLGDVLSAELSLHPPLARISMSKHIDTRWLQQAISRAGDYQILESREFPDMMTVSENPEKVDEKKSYLPIFLIFAYIGLTTAIIQTIKGAFNWMQWMSDFMAGFFLVFSFFKLINLRGFAGGYRQYDLLAKKFFGWGFVYPFVELGLGFAFLTGFNPVLTAGITIFVMAIGLIGVIRSLMEKRAIQCACLGTVIQLQLGKVTLMEDLLMIFMSGAMLITMI